MSSGSFEKLLDLLERLDESNISYTLAHSQQDAITVKVDVPGQRWEIDYYLNGTIDVEILKSDGSILHENAIEELLRTFSD